MFQFRFVRKLSTQRLLLLEAHEYGEVKLQPVLDEQINRLSRLSTQPIESRSERELISLCQVPVAYAIAGKLEQYKRLRQAQQDRLTTVVGEWLRNARLVRYLGWESAVTNRIKGVVKDLTLASTRTRALVLVAYGLTFSWWMLPITGMLLATRFAGAPIKASEFFPAIWFLGLLSNHIQFLPHSLSQYGQAAAAMSRIKEFLSLGDLSRCLKSSGSVLDDPFLGEPIRLHLQDVGLDFGPLPALKNLNLSLELNARTAIVGEVASGKSTFLRLLTADLSPTSGAIEVEFANGLRASLWKAEVRDAVRSRTAYIPQEPFLSNATLRDNIDLWGDRSPEDLARAVTASQLQEDIAIFPRGLDEEVGETGINLSGGQKQRVSIARAILSGRPFFVLDDPLSAVDSHTEKKLFHHLVNGTRGFVLASHRLYELVACDRVLVIDNGHVVEDGDPGELLSNPASRFSKLASSNLDPDGIHSPEVLRNALEKTGLGHTLKTIVLEGGKNFSLGERQLVCLARVLVQERPYVLLDEPTSAVDNITDSLIQNALRTTLAGKTVIAIAHRLDTLGNYDQIVEMRDGNVVRSGTPDEIFRAMNTESVTLEQSYA